MLYNHDQAGSVGQKPTTVAPEAVSPTATAVTNTSAASATLHPELDRLCVQELLLLVADAAHGRKSEAVEVLLRRGLEEDYPALEEAVRDHHNADLRNGAMEVLVAFGEAAVPGLSRLLADRDEELRNLSAVMLGNIGSRLAVSALIEALEDRDANVAHGAAEALGKNRRQRRPGAPGRTAQGGSVGADSRGNRSGRPGG
jgi:HEAT repeat protein